MAKSDSQPAPEGNQLQPLLDIQKIIAQFKIPGVDVAKIAESQQKDIAAVVEANKRAYEGFRALAERQSEMLKEAMTEWQAVMKEMSAKDPAETAAKQADFAKRAFEKALANMRELAEMAAKSQTEAWDVVHQRFQENLAELRRALSAQ